MAEKKQTGSVKHLWHDFRADPIPRSTRYVLNFLNHPLSVSRRLPPLGFHAYMCSPKLCSVPTAFFRRRCICRMSRQVRSARAMQSFHSRDPSIKAYLEDDTSAHRETVSVHQETREVNSGVFCRRGDQPVSGGDNRGMDRPGVVSVLHEPSFDPGGEGHSDRRGWVDGSSYSDDTYPVPSIVGFR